MSVKTLTAAIAIALAAIAVAGCSDDSTSSAATTTTSPKESVCVARDNLKKSLTDLASPSLLTQGKSGIQSAVDTVKANVDALSSAGGAAYKPETDALKSSINDLETSVSNLGSGSLTDNLKAIGTAIGNVGTSGQALMSKVQAACP